MATTVLVPVSEYLSSSYEVDYDYVDGELQERNVGERPHNVVQYILTELFNRNRRIWKLVALQEQRVQVNEHRYRVPDVCVLRRSDPAENIVHIAPLVCIEVLSPEDRMQRILERVRDYYQMGVEHVWIFDPFTRDAWRVLPDSSQQHVADTLTVPDTLVRIDLAEVWTALDDLQSQD